MDGNSIITQVAQENATNNNNNKYDESSDIEITNPFRNVTITNNKKKNPKRKSIFSSFLCCFNSSRNREENKAANDKRNSIISNEKYLLPQIQNSDIGRKCLVIDLDETLVHSSFKPVSNADFIVPVEIEGMIHQVYVLKRPYVDEFLQRMGELYECVLFTASLAKYADPVADLLDKWNVFRARLFREACVYFRGNYVKDLSKLGRDINNVIICDNSPASYIFHPDNAVAVNSWFDDPNDTELIDMIPFMEKLAQTNDIYSILKQGSIVESNNNQEVSSFLQTKQLNADYNQTANKIEKTVLLNKKTSSSFNKIDFINNKNDNLNEDEYTVHENSIIVSVDNSSQKS